MILVFMNSDLDEYMPNEHSENGVFSFLHKTLCVLIVQLIEMLKK